MHLVVRELAYAYQSKLLTLSSVAFSMTYAYSNIDTGMVRDAGFQDGELEQTAITHDVRSQTVPRIQYKGKEVDAIDVGFKVNREDWNEYQLTDGSELRMRLLVSEVYMIPGEYDQNGNPVYVVKSGNVLVVKSPDHLKRPGSE